MNLRNFVRLATALAAAIVSSACYASNTITAIDPHARAVLNKMQSTYSSLNSLSEQIVSQEFTSLRDPVVLHTSVKVLRPAYLLMHSDSKSSRSGSSEVVADGRHCFVTAPEYPSRYLKFSVTAADALKEATSEGITSSFTLALFSNPDAINVMFPDSNLATLSLGRPTKVDGYTVDLVVATDINGSTLSFFIDHSSHMVRKIVVIDPNKKGDFTETYSSVEANAPLSPLLFTFIPPPHTDPFYASSFSQAAQDAPN
jgi:outer membrane lipoprotein-sorting protein